ncbi:ATP-binding protein [Caulobacter sp. NIBR1757]|uniref:ATP-binding protein n=1 Tax=Caulobacter sp. NIBR1757 TaxID=3016000 RepID=UPI0022F044CE|nr:ATP-binding protein [Caulobacter sp. NIBR1757]WGM38197.1 Sensor histidine kinase RcsC [Caulobacter sp. NIBR1757]
MAMSDDRAGEATPRVLRGGNGKITVGRLGILPLVIITAVVILLCATLVVRQAAAAIAEVIQAREEKVLSQGVSRRLTQLNDDIAYVSVWNEAYEKSVLKVDQAWIHENYGQYFADHMRHSLTLMIGPDGRIVYAAEGGKKVSTARLSGFANAARPLFEKVRGQTGQQGAALDMARYRHGMGVVTQGGRAWLVAAGSVAPEADWRGTMKSGREPVIVSAIEMTPAFLRNLQADYDLRGLKLLAPGQRAAAGIDLKGVDGKPVARLGWTPMKPRQAVLGKAGGTFAAMGVCLLLLIILLMLRIRAVADDLKASARAARAADHAKSVFLANMSHEIRTPLNAVLGMAQVMEGDTLEPRQRERLTLIRDAGHTLLGVLNDVLDLSRIEAGQVSITDAPFELDGLAKGVLGAFDGQASAKGVVLKLELSAHGWWKGDAQRIRQIVSNLVSNAVKFTEAGEVRLIIDATAEGLSFRVEDTGPGIAPDILTGLFARFAQADASITRRHGGTGLGLAISRELAELMGGRLTATSELGEGSVFVLELPLARVAAEAPAAAPAATVPLEGAVRILAAEDNAANRRVLAAMLEPLGAELIMVEDGRQLVEAWARGGADVVLADIQMPVMSGLEAARAIRRAEAAQGLHRTPIIALTANVMSDQVAQYMAAGMDSHVAKPIQMAALFAALQAALDGEPSSQALAG